MFKLRILQVSPYGPPMSGGSESFCLNISRQLHKRGHEIVVWTGRYPRSGPKVDYSEGFPIKRFFCVSYVWEINPAFFIIPDILRVVRKFDIVHVHSYIYFSANQLAFCRLLKRFPLILHIHGGLGDVNSRLVGKWKFIAKRFYDKTLAKVTFSASDKIISVSGSDTKFLVDNYKINPTKIVTIPNAVETAKFSMTEQHNPKVATFIGRLVPWKGTAQMPIIFKKLIKKNIHVRVVGDGPDMNFLKKNSDKSVEFTGKLPKKEIPNILKNTSVLILPSFLEGLPTVCLEAMASGVPSVAYDIGGVKDVIKDYESGFLIKKGDVKSFVNKTVQLLQDSQQYESMSKLCYKRARQIYDLDVVTSEIEKEYRSLVV
jgi:glycogen(starch) synthase